MGRTRASTRPPMSDDGGGPSASDGGSAGSAGSAGDEGWERVQRARSLDPSEQEEANVANAEAQLDQLDQLDVGTRILDMFDDHCNHMQRLASARQALLGLRLVTHQDGNKATDGAIAGECVAFVRLPSDRFIGDARLRCVRALLAEIDERGASPSPSAHSPLPTPHSPPSHPFFMPLLPALKGLRDQIIKSASTTPSSGRAAACSTARSGRCTARPS